MQTSWVLQFVLTTLVLLGPGRRFYLKGYPALWRLAPDMNSLVAVGTTAAWAYSVVATFLPGLLPPGTVNVYYRGGGGDRDADPAGPVSGGAGQGPHVAGDQPVGRLAAAHGPCPSG